ncbi:MAG: ATP-binding protein [Eubacteriaceae bacterium]|nr:ATP-binding protein [Eubacteriaceae bacterium]
MAQEIIEDERKKNHGILADELKLILNGSAQPRRSDTPYFANVSKDKNDDTNLFEIIYPEKYLSDLVASPQMKQELERIIHEFQNWDVLVSNGVNPTRRVLFYGAPGCGKTLAAQAIASEIGLPMIYVRFDAVISSYLGETATNLRKVFDFARQESYVMFFDEFDAIARSRNDPFEHGEIKRVVNTFLQQLDNFNGKSLVIAATNFEQSLDYAIWRRFDCTLRFEMPSNDEKSKLFSLRLKQFSGADHVFAKYYGDMEGFSFADIDQIANFVRKQCVLEGRKMFTKKDIEQAVQRQKAIVALRKTQY